MRMPFFTEFCELLFNVYRFHASKIQRADNYIPRINFAIQKYKRIPRISLLVVINGPVAIAGSIPLLSKNKGTKVPIKPAMIITATSEADIAIALSIRDGYMFGALLPAPVSRMSSIITASFKHPAFLSGC